jgi:small subunit ribosomal protein S17
MDKRRRIQGVVFSNKNDKTIGVMLSGYKKHSKYLKRVQFRSKYYADDPKNEAKIGDVVTIEECRPMSKTKRFRLISIDKKALEKVEIAEDTNLEKALHEEKPVEETVKVEETKPTEVKATEKKAAPKKAAAKKVVKAAKEEK